MSLEETVNGIENEEFEKKSLKKFGRILKTIFLGMGTAYLTLAGYVLANSDKVDKHNQNLEPIVGTLMVAAAVGYEIRRSLKNPERTKTDNSPYSGNNFPYFWE